ncbi:metalloregulator ArsR/SmtB family transcription factor [Desulfovibrio sp. OttesenSCG-928-F07]|nr:metalloregulator ArsR/SmtB family transcription factor [Desulfovibrio sp. OttesenSCG-928-F07]
MKTENAAELFEALSSATRLDIFRLLVKNAPAGLVAGDIAKHLGLSANNLSFHLKSLLYSGLVSVEKEGRFLRYSANIPLMLNVISFLTAECCYDNPEQCKTYRTASGIAPEFLPHK